MTNNIVEIPAGLIKFPTTRQTIENIDNRAMLDYAAEASKLSFSERYALNKEFFPDGNGFKLFTPESDTVELSIYQNKKRKKEDKFTKELLNMEFPPNITTTRLFVKQSSKNCFQANLEQALKKLKQFIMF